jgi:DNA polymerase
LRALRIRQVLASASVKKLFALDAMTARDGRVREMYMMHATHHGRTGGYGPQPANLYKGEWHTPEEVNAALTVLASRSLDTVERAYPKLSALDVVNNCLRSLFVAAPGHTLISSDYSAIEGVVLAALAGESWVLEVFHTHGMIYEAQIARMIGVPFEDFVKHRVDTGGTATYGPDGKLIGIKGGKHHPLRQQGKLAVLSGGYASWINGWKKFGADEYYDGDREIKAAIMSYRNSVPAIVEFWGGQTRDKFRNSEREELYGLEGAAIAAVLKPGECFRVGAIALQMGGDTLYMQLPSGRTIPYHSPRLRPATRDYASPWELALTYEGWNSNPEKGLPAWIEMDLYGGVLTQNATGGTARDIQMHGMENVTAAGYPIVMHTYDETVAEVPLIETLSAKSVAGLEQGLNDLPAYAKGWPIFAKGGWLGPRYGKWD